MIIPKSFTLTCRVHELVKLYQLTAESERNLRHFSGTEAWGKSRVPHEAHDSGDTCIGTVGWGIHLYL